jgi:hypothetical protein
MHRDRYVAVFVLCAGGGATRRGGFPFRHGESAAPMP